MKLLKYRNLLLFVISGILAIYLGLFQISFIDKSDLYVHSIYYWLSINILLLLSTLYEVVNNEKITFIGFFKKHRLALIISSVLIILSFFNCKPEFRIFADEMVLLSTSQNLYESKECYADMSLIKHPDGNKEVLSKIIDKRPALFSYLTSVIHSIIGYSYKNPFILNFVCGILILFFFYLLVSLKYGRFYGILGLLCLYLHPLFAWYVNSAGFDIFNILCSLILFLLSWNFFKTPSIINAELLLLFLPILGQSRYESSLMVFITLPFVFYYLPKSKYSEFSYKFWVFPILLLPIAWLKTITTFVDKSEGMNSSNPFAIEYLIENLKQAMVFFFSGIEVYGVIPIISIFALIGFIIYILKIKECKLGITKALSLYVTCFYLIHILVKFSFCLGDITVVLANRHALIFLPIIVYLAIKFLVWLQIKYKFDRKYYILGIIFLFLVYGQEFGKNYDEKQMPICREFRFIRNYLENNHKEKNSYVLIYSKPVCFTTLGYSSINYSVLRKYQDDLIKYYKDRNCQYFLSVQYMIEKNNNPFPGEELPDGFKQEKILEQKLENNYYLRISKCYPKQ